ncbi:MAG: glycerol-3-phosphate 1-O-acyltransferase [Halioglobus sp.]
MDLSDTLLQGNPWPDSAHNNVLFLLDVHNTFEEEILNAWIKQYAKGDTENVLSIGIDLGNDDKPINAEELSATLTLPPETIVAPLRVSWLHGQADENASPRIRHLLLGDPRRPSPRRARKIIETTPEQMHLVHGAPDTLANLRERFALNIDSQKESEQAEFARFVGRQASIVLDLAERSLRGGRYKVPRHVASTLLARRSFQDAVEELSAASGKSKAALMEEAKEYMGEMVSKPSTFWLDVYAKFNNFCLSLGYEEKIVYDEASVEKMRQLVRENPSMLLWTHKTYLDGMVVPKVLYDNDFPMPHMFGGANLNFPGLGYLLHRAGAIFIKRSFQDNELYKITLRHYVGYLMEKRFPMNWSFEGTRSRMGKLMPPRYGLLKYVLEACHSTDAQNIHIIPISISYDLIRDVEEYATEQTGRGKGAESLRWFVGYVRSLARPMGKVYMDIGEPVVLPKAPDPEDSLALSKIAFEVAVQANQVTPITFPSLVTMSLLGSAPKALTQEEVLEDITRLLNWARERNLRTSRDLNQSYSDKVEELLEIMIDEGIITRYDEGPEVIYGIGINQHPVASYYRNTVIHFFVNKAIIELALLRASENEGEGALDIFWTEVDRQRDLFKFEFFYDPTEEFHRQIREELNRYAQNWEELVAQGTVGLGQLLTGMVPLVSHATLQTFTEAYSVVATLTARMDHTESLTQEECVTKALNYGRQAYLQRRIGSEASIGKLLFKNAFKTLESRGLAEAGDASLTQQRQGLAKELREQLRRLELISAIASSSRSSSQTAL